MKIRLIILFLLISVLSFSCGGGGGNDEKEDPSKAEYKPLTDEREKSEGPVVLKDGINFSIYAPDAKYISLVGDFNNWIDNRHPMQKNKAGVWAVTIPLRKGEYSYKFNIDGNWIIDNNNPSVVKDSLGDRRSHIIVKEDTLFYREPLYFGYTNAFPPVVTRSGVQFTYNDKYAGSVFVAGSFNNWEKEEFPLAKNQNGIWSGYVQIPRGEYYYKFSVDGMWKPDPMNPQAEDDGYGNRKSFLKIVRDIEDRPDRPFVINYEIVQFHFYNKELPSHHTVSVIGTFNNWEPERNIMTDSDMDKEWFTTVRLTEGEYYYKFLLAGREFFDPENEQRQETPDNRTANYLKVSSLPGEYNVKFTYNNSKARRVFLTGDFNNWDVEADEYQKDETGLWYIVKKLRKGQYLYQLVVDGEWMLDSNNPYTAFDINNDMNSFLAVE